MAAHLVPMDSTSDMTKFLIRNLIKIGIESNEKQNSFVTEATGLDLTQRLQMFRQKATKPSKLTVKEHLELIDGAIRKNNPKYLDDPRFKELKTRILILEPSYTDSEGYFDITDVFGTNIFFLNLSFNDKLKGIFITIDENGDGYLSRPEVEKFFSILLKNTISYFKITIKNYKDFGLSEENAMQANKLIPELEKVFDPNKLTRLVNGAFEADKDKKGLITFKEWETFIVAGNFVDQWGTISILFDK